MMAATTNKTKVVDIRRFPNGSNTMGLYKRASGLNSCKDLSL